MTGLADKPRCFRDTNVFIGVFEQLPPQVSALKALFETFENVPAVAVTSELIIDELLDVGSLEDFDRLKDIYSELLINGTFIKSVPIDLNILLATVALRRNISFKLPDAIHVAPASTAQCRFFLSSGRDMRRVPSPLEWIDPNPPGITTIPDTLRA